MSTTITTHAGDTAIIAGRGRTRSVYHACGDAALADGPRTARRQRPVELAELCREDLEGREVLRTVADSTGDPDDRLVAELRDQLVIGGLLGPGGLEMESVLLDGATGEISTTNFLHDRPDLMDRRPLAPSL